MENKTEYGGEPPRRSFLRDSALASLAAPALFAGRSEAAQSRAETTAQGPKKKTFLATFWRKSEGLNSLFVALGSWATCTNAILRL
jgi:hypothetical protein